jgi:hypothetical protein
MKLKHSLFAHSVFALSLLVLSACAGSAPKIDGGQYWQRVSVSEAVYMQGPKAQQMLNRDIGRCVTDLREQERLGLIKDAIPTDYSGRVLDPDENKVADWDTPEHDGTLLTEHTDYHDFEGCMLSKGWERIKAVPFEVAENARRNFYLAHIDYGYDPKLGVPGEEGGVKANGNTQTEVGRLND